MISDCTANVGLQAGDHCNVINCTVNANFSGIVLGNDCSVDRCLANGNQFNGISVGNGCMISGCTANKNANNGIVSGNGGRFTDCIANDNVQGGGIFCNNAATINHCTANNNRGGGFGCQESCLVKECISVSNRFDGIAVGSQCQLVGNTCSQNSVSGIEALGSRNWIESNHVVHNAVKGISVIRNGVNIVVRNHAADNGNNYLGANFDVPSGNRHGPYVTDLDVDQISSATGWENFSGATP